MTVTRPDALAPLRVPVFRRILFASLFSSFGQLILGVGAAWEMTRISEDPALVAMVQTALLLPLMLVTLPAGALADMFDRKLIAMLGLGFSTGAGAVLTCLSFLDLLTAWSLLSFCALISAGLALFSPAWQASIREQVSGPLLPAAVALGSISFNISRSIGPAIGGVIVATAGARPAFTITACAFVPMIFAFALWNKNYVPPRLPPERIDRAVVQGVRFAINASHIKIVLIRLFLFGFSVASYTALAPLIARDLLGGDATTFGILLGGAGVGAIVGAALMSRLTEKIGPEPIFRACVIASIAAIGGMGLSHELAISVLCFMVMGASNMLVIGISNVTLQISAPRWVAARVLALFTSSLAAGLAIGSVFWGKIADVSGLAACLLFSSTALLIPLITSFLKPLDDHETRETEALAIEVQPDVSLDLNLRSGPIVVELEYDVHPDEARSFYQTMLGLQKLRQRNGAFSWSLSRDVTVPARWIEEFKCPTWGDYLRMRERYTQSDLEVIGGVNRFDRNDVQVVRRRLERPFGSVRWRADTPDLHEDELPYGGP